MIQAVINATGVEPVGSAGKPESAMYDEARILAAHDGATPVAREQCLAIGDRLDTDIEAGNRGDYDSLAVLTGVTDPQQLLHAPEHLRPTYVSEDLRGLLTAMPQPTRLPDGSWRCADAQANVERGRLTVSDPTSINALRAALCTTWERADAGEDTDTTAVGFAIA